MERQLTEIVEKHLEGNYLVGSENKAKMISEILALFSVNKRCKDGCTYSKAMNQKYPRQCVKCFCIEE